MMKIPVGMFDYSVFEVLFSNEWKWVRKRSKKLWVKNKKEPGHVWVKWDKDFIHMIDPEIYLIEDYTEK